MAAKKTVSNADETTLLLIEEVKARKKEISALERPNWKTNMSLPQSGTPNSLMTAPTNLHTVSDVRLLISLAAELRARKREYNETAKELGVEAPEFVWGTFSVEDWLSDIKTRINRSLLESKRKKLESLESRLAAVISPELKAQMELQAIRDELG